MIDWHRATVLTAAEFDVARDLLDLGRNPAVLELLSPGFTDVERARVVRECLDTLASRGLFTGTAFGPDLVDDLRTVVAPEFQHDLVVAPPSWQRALVARRAGRAVLATRIGDDVALVRVLPDDASAVLVELLGEVVPGPGAGVRIPVAVLGEAAERSGGDADRLVHELLRRGCSAAEAEMLRRMGQVAGVAQLGAGRRGPDPCRAPGVLLVHATADGCYAQRRPTPDVVGGPLPDDAVVQAGPADPAYLVRELDRLADAAQRRRAPVGTHRAW
ncbi:ESX secretion-associated protein EspG [Pseudonocardia sp. ICBG1293]|uniref:ESX secretion-associated protein EspG n=1 Tax=Pseudonocardia sp. ICBG1293 TaxID=2844382 RepID=UPI001CCAE7C9|nr:ESX secretion-associated protein EspG [Pseudonocardia sp. ICBG1293]